MPRFGVFLKGNFGVGSDEDTENTGKLVLVVRIPYLRPKRSPPESPESSATQESWSLSEFISQVAPGLENDPSEDDELSVHQAIFTVLNNGLRKSHLNPAKGLLTMCVKSGNNGVKIEGRYKRKYGLSSTGQSRDIS